MKTIKGLRIAFGAAVSLDQAKGLASQAIDAAFAGWAETPGTLGGVDVFSDGVTFVAVSPDEGPAESIQETRGDGFLVRGWEITAEVAKDIVETQQSADYDYWLEFRPALDQSRDLSHWFARASCPEDFGNPGDKAMIDRMKWTVLDRATIAAAMRKVLETMPGTQAAQAIAADCLLGEQCAIDCEAADVVLQVAVFGEVVYG